MSIPEETMEKEIKLLNKLKQIAEEYICLKEDYQYNPVLIEYEYASACRNNKYKCGEEGTYFIKKNVK